MELASPNRVMADTQSYTAYMQWPSAVAPLVIKANVTLAVAKAAALRRLQDWQTNGCRSETRPLPDCYVCYRDGSRTFTARID